MSQDYRGTVFLPATDFPMRADLPKREPALLERWQKLGMYRRLRDAAKGREKFVLHDGPPYANGHIHMGTALNKILKDVVTRSQQMLGKDSVYVPGWDCHGLPIEWQIEQEYRKRGKDKDAVPIADFRKECRDFAERWIAIQKSEFKRLGCEGDWDDPYTTMAYASEAGIYRELAKFLLSGSLYRGKKSVMWSVVEKTALAEAEVEYHDHTSTTIWVRFPVTVAPGDVAAGRLSLVIWTTTPWTIPANRAIAYSPRLNYIIVRVGGVDEKSRARLGERFILAKERLDQFCEDVGITEKVILQEYLGDEEKMSFRCKHPLSGFNNFYSRIQVKVREASFVTADQGTGLVHIAPSHGEDDFEFGQTWDLDVPDTVAEDGTYTDAAPGFTGQHVFKVVPAMLEALESTGALLAQGTLVHSYPHSWRSKAPLIFRATAQWFIPMDAQDNLRIKALLAIDETRWVPERGRNRIRSMIEDRPDWCVSRQRSWGVPIAVFVHKTTQEVLRDQAVVDRIAEAFAAEGADAWFTSEPARFLGNAYDPAEYEQVTDILDVWFDSGCTHAIVLEQRPELKWPASLYLEGSDQHRGWFHSSLLESCGTRGRAPYEAVLTHGFVVDSDGRKMSKSLGNVVSPIDLMKAHGADILRLWVVSADYSEDIRIGDEILKGQADAYRRLRNTLRYLLGNLAGFDEAERVAAADMPELERWVLHRLAELDRLARECIEAFDFPRFYAALHNFCATDLSAFYFDVRKDTLYCDRPDSLKRRSARTVLDRLFGCLTVWLAPVLVYTAEEAWLTRHPSETDSIHLQVFPELPATWLNPALGERWERVRQIRRVVTGAIEIERREKRLGASLQASPTVYLAANDLAALDGLDMAELAITSGIALTTDAPPTGAHVAEDAPGIAVVPSLATGEKCQRCWQVLEEVDATSDGLCHRCQDAVAHAAH